VTDRTTDSPLEILRELSHAAPSAHAHTDGLTSRITRAAVIVALLAGLLGGISTAGELWRAWHARPDLSIVLGNSLTIDWDRRQRILSFTRWITLRNDGDVTGVIENPPRVRLERAPPGEAIELTDIQVEEKGSTVGFPLSVHARDSRDVQVTMRAPAPAGGTEFITPGDYRLYLWLDTLATPEPQRSCIRFRTGLIAALSETGHARNATPDACDG